MNAIFFLSLTIGAVVVWHLIVYLPVKWLLSDAQEFSAESFKAAYPNRRWLPLIYRIFSYAVIFIALIIGAIIFEVIPENSHTMYLFLVYGFGILNLYSGVFEIITATVPTRGVMTKWITWQTYIYSPRARLVGVVRIVLTLISYVVCAGIYLLTRNLFS